MLFQCAHILSKTHRPQQQRNKCEGKAHCPWKSLSTLYLLWPGLAVRGHSIHQFIHTCDRNANRHVQTVHACASRLIWTHILLSSLLRSMLLDVVFKRLVLLFPNSPRLLCCYVILLLSHSTCYKGCFNVENWNKSDLQFKISRIWVGIKM